MNTIPHELIAIPDFHGYFYHPKERVVYSLKVTGKLKPLAFSKGHYVKGHGFFESGYNLSRKGRKYRFSREQLDKIIRKDYQVPYEARTSK